jgi:hypothetical protein
MGKAGDHSIEDRGRMIPLRHDPWFTFRFAKAQIVREQLRSPVSSVRQ